MRGRPRRTWQRVSTTRRRVTWAEALRLRRHIAAVLDELAERPLVGREERIRGFRRPVRSWPVPPLRIYYEPQPEGLFVVRTDHQARRPITR